MANSDTTPKYFDYLDDHASRLQASLKINDDLIREIQFCRINAMHNPEMTVVQCRVIIEKILKGQLGESAEGFNLKELIEEATDQGMIDRFVSYKFQEIRRKGNKGAHGGVVRILDAKNCLEMLDDILRWQIAHLEIDQNIPLEVPRGTDEVFLTNESVDLAKNAKTASILSGDHNLEKEAKNALKADNDLKLKISKELTDVENAFFVAPSASEKDNGNELLALAKAAQDNLQNINDIDGRVHEVLSEYDYINKLLKGDNHATEKQFEVMAFPKTSSATTNVLQIAGGAGTGKTLCLIAKLILDVTGSEQMSLLPTKRKRALFICFNKSLAAYVRGLLSQYPNQCEEIDVESYDNFFNQLVKAKPKPGYEHLSKFAKDVRYPTGTTITYDTKHYVECAMEKVAARYPNQAKAYYLDASTGDNVSWMDDEIAWLEARYENPSHAEAYLTAPRTGRGGSRLPNSSIRRVILDVWKEFCSLLLSENHYTIGQAIKRLLDSNSLPKYDAIAIDEAQDLSLLTIKLLLEFRANGQSRIYISGDENQKIYKRDFTWKELGASVTGHTISLQENKRNSPSIAKFADRLLGKQSTHQECCTCIHVKKASCREVIELVKNILSSKQSETTAIIANDKKGWENALSRQGISPNPVEHGLSSPGVYCLGPLANKGLEFDNVIVFFSNKPIEDEEEERHLRYVHFTRAKKRLYISYEGETPRLLVNYYSDFLNEEKSKLRRSEAR